MAARPTPLRRQPCSRSSPLRPALLQLPLLPPLLLPMLALASLSLLAVTPAAAFDFSGIFGGGPTFGQHATDELTDDDFDDFVKKHPVSAVLFYAPWCFYSQQIMPAWDTASQKLLLHDPPVQLAKIDSHKYGSVGDRFDVSAFPTMKLFIDGAVFEYDQDLGRSWQQIVKWVNRHIDRDHVLKSVEDADHFLHDNDLFVVGLFPDDSTASTFLKSSRHFSDVMFAEARGEVATQIGATLGQHVDLSCETIRVGKSPKNTKEITLPREKMHCTGQPRNPQRPDWTDKYEASVAGDILTVKRADHPVGWEQNLMLRCCNEANSVSGPLTEVKPPAVAMFMPHDERFAIYDGDFEDLHALDRFITSRRTPMVNSFNQDVAEKIFEGSNSEHLPGLFLITMKEEPELEATFRKAAKSLRGRAFLCVSGRTSHLERRLSALAGIEDDFTEPVLTLIQPRSSGLEESKDAAHPQSPPHHGPRKFRLDTKTLTEESIIKFVTDFEADALKPWMRSEAEPTAEDMQYEIVDVLVGTTLTAAAEEESKDVLVNFYAPWCGHCRKLEPQYKALAKKLKHVKTLKIAKIDATRNEVEGLQIMGYPTIILFPAGKSPKKHVFYRGNRSPEDFIQFIQEHATHKFDPTAPAVPDTPLTDGGLDPVAAGLIDPSEEDL
eukprot:CAMPEP_0206480638 /NCGR_PEP_ID=MMETSP0324_2-20121206/37522_1 /ASSEMBLY_ACC=CAM_ASM_000836 /TAXON_ID=2866 /ORGANISM="Crypthecodinium cohnii, Strain Seligo" /LENGTH=664 /DNA_ID=CAMNT_0053957681 /DNA_START=191 /DNA_END=2185 /DNA_ORIENTATION=-